MVKINGGIFHMTNIDRRNASLVYQAIGNIRTVLMKKNIQDVKISDITSVANISKSKFFSFFGGINTVLELVIAEELDKIYELIGLSIKNKNDRKNLVSEISLLRTIYIRKNIILKNYYQISEQLPSRYDKLKEAIFIKEQYLQLNILKEC
ncbi:MULTISPECIES: hypothetical protein [Bacteroidota]|uniref:TetR/AcrR family transcriptional regulator n=2 Tax=Bacteroidota/Chlorobiota group TaxID=68336 RepID=A0A7H9DRF2_9FLAO|nr:MULTISPECIES: hypothetical protein [Bacteroidota]OCK50358.1 hypothetical protein BA768_20020 [Chryseobacterium sp. CBo1]MBW3524933.1 hypothetical protein [Chryseobacterium sp. NKUCC03_KSP]MCT1531799.1 hypothetical protein [Sphingobacterium daejeonense]MDM1461417.1 hypothetical protein [Myroides odoratimimus]OJZ02509.1 MAG: hypothetical protein BGP15_07970 [Sphingobacterium sp. 40-24]